MKVHLVSGGCGFVGRNMVKRLYRTTQDKIFFIDDLSVGTDPSTWLDHAWLAKKMELKYMARMSDCTF